MFNVLEGNMFRAIDEDVITVQKSEDENRSK